MIPKRLPNLAATAIRNGWCVEVTNDGTRVAAVFQRHGPHRTDYVWLDWERAALRISTINGISTPYAQCIRLIRSPEGATS